MRNFIRTHRIEVLISAAGLIVVTSFLVAPTYHGPSIDAENAAHYGDFIGGFIGTFLLFVSASLLVAAYKQHEKTEFSRSFETHFFEMLKYHRDNMREIEIEGISGRRAFVYIFREWRLAIDVVRIAEKNSGISLDVKSRARLGYLAVFHGSGPNARRDLYRDASKLFYETKLLKSLIDVMSTIWTNHPKDHSKYARVRYQLSAFFLSRDLQVLLEKSVGSLRYKPFGGHHSRLSHYYRHLHQLVDHVHKSAPEKTKMDHIRLVAVQLSTHEQALLALHAFSVESRWQKNPSTPSEFIDKYDLIADVPEEFFKSHVFPIWEIYKLKRQQDRET